MRKALKELGDYRGTFTGVFARYGSKHGWRGAVVRTLLFTDVRHKGHRVCDHLWMNETRGFSSLSNLQPGDEVQFDARIARYYKGYLGDRDYLDPFDALELDFKLSRPTKISIVKKGGSDT